MKYILSVLSFFVTVGVLAQVDESVDVMPPDDTLEPPPPLLVTPFASGFSLIVDAAASPTGEELAVSTPGNVLLFRIKEKLNSGGFTCPYPEQVSKLRYVKPAKVLLFAPDNRHLLTLDSDGSVKVRDKRDGQVIKAIAIPNETIMTFAYNKRKSLLLTGTARGSVWIYDANTYEVVNKFNFPNQIISCLAATDDLVMAGDRNGGLTLITISSGETKIIPKATYSELYTADITGDGRYGVCGAHDLIMLVDLKDFKVITRSPGTQLYRVAFTPTGDQILVGHNDGISGYDLKGNRLFADTERFKNGIFFEFIPNTTTMARIMGSEMRGTPQIEIVATDSRRVTSVINNTTSAVSRLAFSADNKNLLFAQESAIKSIDLASGVLTDHPSLSDVSFSRDRRTVTFNDMQVATTGDVTRTWKMMNTSTGNVSAIAGYGAAATSGKQDLQLSADSKQVGYAAYQAGRWIFYANDLSGKQVHSFPGWSGVYQQRFEFTPSSNVILNTRYLYNEGRMRLVNLADTTRQLDFEDATRLAYVGPHLVIYDNTTRNIRWINTATFKTDQELPLKNAPKFAAFNSNKTEVAFVELHSSRHLTQGWFMIYNVKTRQRLRSFSFDSRDIPEVTDVRWSPNGKTFIVAATNGLITFVDAQRGQWRAMLLAEHLGANFVAMDDQLRWTGTADGLACMLQVEKEGVPVDPAELQRNRNAQLLKALLLD